MTGTVDLPLIHPRERVDVIGAARSSRRFKSLRDCYDDEEYEFRQLKICIVTQDFVGPVKNGGIGTAYTYAAKAFAKAGHDVTVLYSIKSCSDKTLGYWTDHYAKLGIKFVPVSDPEIEIMKGPSSSGTGVAYQVFEWLKRNDHFDFVHASEWKANAYFCLQAKQTGLYFKSTKFVIKCSSPTLWNHIGNGEPICDIKTLTWTYMERRSVELADYVICGSQYLLNWMEDQGYVLPLSRTFVQPNIFPVDEVLRDPQVDSVRAKELVFFGRLEPRKGLHFFIDALVQLKAKGFFNSIAMPKVSLLGKPRPDFNYKTLVNKLERELEISVNLICDKNQVEALEYLNSGSGRVAVMPSLMDNSPFGVYECLSLSIPFITSTAGGGKELILESMRPDICFEPTSAALASSLKKIIENGCPVAEPSFDFDSNIREWMQWHLWANSVDTCQCENEGNSKSLPLVSVCIAHHNRGVLLENAIESLLAQSYSNIEIIIVDDGSTDDESLGILNKIEDKRTERFPIKVVRQENKYLGAVRNSGIAHSRGEFVMFMDDDNEAKPNEVETFVKVAKHTGAEILTCWSDSFSKARPADLGNKTRRIVFQGENLAMALVRNPYGDSNCFARKDALARLNGFTEHYKVGLDDSEFFTRAILSGMKVMLIPESLYWYRINEVRMRQGQHNLYDGRTRMCEPFTQGLHPDLANIVRYAQGMGYVHGPWKKKVGMSGGAGAPLTVVEFARRLVSKFPFLYPLAKYIHYKLH